MSVVTKEMNSTRSDELEVSDTLLATFLQCEGFRVLRITGQDPHNRFFVFENGPEVTEQIQRYALGNARIEPHRFGRLYRTSLRMLHRS